eukprot:272125_1
MTPYTAVQASFSSGVKALPRNLAMMTPYTAVQASFSSGVKASPKALLEGHEEGLTGDGVVGLLNPVAVLAVGGVALTALDEGGHKLLGLVKQADTGVEEADQLTGLHGVIGVAEDSGFDTGGQGEEVLVEEKVLVEEVTDLLEGEGRLDDGPGLGDELVRGLGLGGELLLGGGAEGETLLVVLALDELSLDDAVHGGPSLLQLGGEGVTQTLLEGHEEGLQEEPDRRRGSATGDGVVGLLNPVAVLAVGGVALTALDEGGHKLLGLVKQADTAGCMV